MLNTGTINGVQCYKADSIHGLTPIPNTDRSLGITNVDPADNLNTPSQLIFSSDRSKLIATVKGPNGDGTGAGYSATWNVALDGSLSTSFVKSAPAGPQPFGQALIPGHNAIIMPDALLGYEIFDFSKSEVGTVTRFPIANQLATCWVAFSQKTQTFFLDDALTGLVYEVKVDQNLDSSVIQSYNTTSNILENRVATVGANE